MAILNNNQLVGASGNQGYNINNSLRFRSSASAYLNRTPASAGNRQTWTWSAWVKLGTLSTFRTLFYNSNGATSNGHGGIYLETDNTIWFAGTDNGSSYTNAINTSAVFRDPSAWYHIVVVCDTTNATSANRSRIYVNGNQQSVTTTQAITQNANLQINKNTRTDIGLNGYTGGTGYFDGYMAEVNFIDGQALTPSSFGGTDAITGVWKPKAYSGTYGTNGFYLKFADASAATAAAIGKDSSSNGNNWTPNNISVTSGTTYDAMTDSPTNTSATVANYSTLNPLKFAGTLSNANLNLTATAASWQNASSTLFVNSGKWYFEATIITRAATFGCMVGIGTPDSNISTTYGSGDTFTYLSDGTKYGSGSFGGAYGATFTAGDVIGVAFDCDARTITFYKNNVSQGTAFSNLVAGSSYGAWLGVHTSASSIALNCGQRPFAYTPPTGFVALNTYNLPTPTILQGNKYMDATTYSGTGSAQSITNAGAFKPDFVWMKQRNAAVSNVLMNSVTGTSVYLKSDTNDAQITDSTILTSFNSNGFTLGTSVGVNSNTGTYVGWQWQAGQGSTSSNTSGSITSTVSVNTTAGFSVVTYTGTASASNTIGHGLGVAPSMIIVKSRSAAGFNWMVYHVSTGATRHGYLNLANAFEDPAGVSVWNDTAPTSTIFTISNNGNVNGSGVTFVAYCWAEIAGFSRFGSYTGNASTDGPFVYTGFRPKFIMIKNSSAVTSWVIFDSVRLDYNLTQAYLVPNSAGAEGNVAGFGIDILSNGFKPRTADATINGSTNTHIYMAFAENPFKNANAR